MAIGAQIRMSHQEVASPETRFAFAAKDPAIAEIDHVCEYRTRGGAVHERRQSFVHDRNHCGDFIEPALDTANHLRFSLRAVLDHRSNEWLWIRDRGAVGWKIDEVVALQKQREALPIICHIAV